MEDLIHDPNLVYGVFYLLLALAIGFLIPTLMILIYFDLAKERHYTRWGAIVHLADNMENQTNSLFGYIFRQSLFFLVIFILIYLAIIDPPVFEWLDSFLDKIGV